MEKPGWPTAAHRREKSMANKPVIGYQVCPHCGAPMTDEAVDMVMERMETLYETT